MQASRAQVDIDRYPRAMSEHLLSHPRISFFEGEVVDVLVEDNRVDGIVLGSGERIHAPAVILTTGTFLSGVMHCGERQDEGGRIGDGASSGLSANLTRLGLRLARLKTGTTPRLDARTIDWARLQVQDDVVEGGRFSFSPAPSPLPQLGSKVML